MSLNSRLEKLEKIKRAADPVEFKVSISRDSAEFERLREKHKNDPNRFFVGVKDNG